VWRPNITKKQGFISKFLEQRKLEREDMQESQFHWKRIHTIKESQNKIVMPSIEDIPKEAKTVYPKELAVEMRFAAIECKEADIYIYAARKDSDPVLVAEGELFVGNRIYIDELEKRYYFVDEIRLYNHWLSEIRIANVRNGCSRLIMRTHGYNRIFTKLEFEVGTWVVDMVGAIE